MSNIGHADLGDSIRIETSITNISSVVANVDSIKISVVDSANTVVINTTSTNVSNYATGKYRYDLYVDPTKFSEGLYYQIWSGHNVVGGRNFSYYEENSFYVEANRLV